MTELEIKELEWLERYSEGKKELRRKAQEQGCLPDYANFDLEFWREIYREGKEAGAKESGVFWHNLKENPEDLPDTDRDVIVKREHEDDTELDNYYNDDEWVGWGNTYRNYQYFVRKGMQVFDDVVAWCEKPKFEEA